jgi:ABC-type iron transport system FetAB permease component
MLCGNAIAGVSVTLSYVLKELEYASLSRTTSKKLTTRLQREPDKTETYLAFGASRFEACRPLVVDALRLSLMPVINQMRCAHRPRA